MMDRALKERLVGAVVLVGFAVLLVPIFLDGESRGIKNDERPIKLPGQGDSDGKPTAKVVVLDRERAQPLPIASSGSRASGSAKEVQSEASDQPPSAPPEARKAAANTAAETRPSAVSAAGTGMFAVQLGSFSKRDNAERLAAQLREKGFAAFLSQTESGSGSMHRVRIGPQADRATADAVAAKLAQAGHNGQVVSHP